MLGIKIINATATGKRFNQHKSINWSYLNLGNVALNHTKKKQKIQVLIPSTIEGILIKKSLTDEYASISKIKQAQ